MNLSKESEDIKKVLKLFIYLWMEMEYPIIV